MWRSLQWSSLASAYLWLMCGGYQYSPQFATTRMVTRPPTTCRTMVSTTNGNPNGDNLWKYGRTCNPHWYQYRKNHPTNTNLGFFKCSSTSRPMTLTTPESVIKKLSTQIFLDDLIDESVRTKARRPIMMQYDPSSRWIWRRWKGTVFSETWGACLRNMVFAFVVSIVFKLRPGILQHLVGFDVLWGQLLSVTTFTLTFFLNQSYAVRQKCYDLSRKLQGRLNDLGMTLAAHAARTNPIDNPEERPTYTKAAKQTLHLMARYIRVYNLLTYASFTGSHYPINTPQGMRRLVERGVITKQEGILLSDSKLRVTHRHNAILLWIIRLFIDSRKAGIFEGGDGFEAQVLDKCHIIRGQHGAIKNELQGRMPLAYVHIVQVLVDVILKMYPFMAYSIGMSPVLGAMGTALLTMFYQGLLDLAKHFLDPYDNEDYGKGEDPLCIDTLIAETNAGSVRWINGLVEQPYTYQDVVEGNLLEYQLPLKGWTGKEVMEHQKQDDMHES